MGGNRLSQRTRPQRSRVTTRMVGAAAAIAILLGTVGIVADAGVAAAQTPPTIVSSRVTPAKAVAGSAITFTWRVKSATGVSFTSLAVTGPNFSFLSSCFGSGTLVSGSAKSGSYRQACVLPTHIANGTWTTQIDAGDNSGQGTSVAGPSFTVTGGLTASPPTFGPASLNRTSVVAGHPITVTWQVDSPIGVSATSVSMNGPGAFGQFACASNGTLISGTSTAGTYRESCVIPKASFNGTWTTYLDAQDVAGQSSDKAGPSFTVTGGTVKTTTPPQIGFSSVTPTTVATGQTVTFTWQITDAGPISYTSVDPFGPGNALGNTCSGQGTLIASKGKTGTYQEPCTIPTNAPIGKWNSLINVIDNAGQFIGSGGPGFTVVPIQITTTALPGGLVKSPYGATLSAIGGSSQYQWSLAGGSLPPGLSLGVNGVIRVGRRRRAATRSPSKDPSKRRGPHWPPRDRPRRSSPSPSTDANRTGDAVPSTGPDARAASVGSSNQVRNFNRAGGRLPCRSTAHPGSIRRISPAGANRRTDGDRVVLGPPLPPLVVAGRSGSSSPMRWLA